MAVYEVFSHPEYRRYKTHICSKATIIQIFCIIITFIPPFFIAYKSKGFWNRIEVYYEQPDILFNHEIILYIQLLNNNGISSDYLTWSTMQNFNQLHLEKLRIPLVKARENDKNRDGKMDSLDFKMEIPVLDLENVVGFQLLLFFDYKLHKYTELEMQSMAHISYTSPVAGAMYSCTGDLAFKQKELLKHRGLDTEYNVMIVDSSSIYAEDYDLNTIFRHYAERNMSTVFTNVLGTWTAGRPAGSPFVIDVEVQYPEEILRYSAGIWQLLKWGWIQYAAILLVFIFVMDRIKIFIFQNQLVTTMVERPFKTKVY